MPTECRSRGVLLYPPRKLCTEINCFKTEGHWRRRNNCRCASQTTHLCHHCGCVALWHCSMWEWFYLLPLKLFTDWCGCQTSVLLPLLIFGDFHTFYPCKVRHDNWLKMHYVLYNKQVQRNLLSVEFKHNLSVGQVLVNFPHMTKQVEVTKAWTMNEYSSIHV